MNTFYAVKVESRPKSGEEIERAFVHVLCDGERKSVPGIVITGVYGDVSASSNRYPFVILKDGLGDYGTSAEEAPDRFFQTNFRTKSIVVGELFSSTSAGPEQPARETTKTFEIVEVILAACSHDQAHARERVITPCPVVASRRTESGIAR
jgi:hypothetical protein